MRIIFVLTYPSYHGVADPAEWLRWDNRDRKMPGLLAAAGVDVELWALAREPGLVRSTLPGQTPYPIRFFAPDNPFGPSRDHRSEAMARAGRNDAADLFVLVGTNGGAGFHFFDEVLRPGDRRFALIVGGDYWSRIVPHAAFVFPESARQERALARPGWRWWRRAIPAERMERLPKSIDTTRFAPQDGRKRWDVIATSRLTRWKRFDEVAALADSHRVAVIGDGPDGPRLRARFPKVEWLGHVPNSGVPVLLDQARLFFHAGRRDYFPRAIVEAMACGLPVAAFDDRIGPDVLPPNCGILVRDADYRARVAALLADEGARAAMGAAARKHATAVHGPGSTAHACATLMALAA